MVTYALIWGFLKWWYPTTMGFPTKNDHLGVFWGYHHLRKHPYISLIEGKVFSRGSLESHDTGGFSPSASFIL